PATAAAAAGKAAAVAAVVVAMAWGTAVKWEVVVCGWESAGGHGNVGSGCCHGGDVVVRMAAGVVVLVVGDRRSSEVAGKVAAVHGVGGWWIG
nr:hypothetical protein [Tanacetum cinerariifolium]GFB66502.1 hypothetical protein [Tanacetum cinerariifolium]